MKKQICRNCHFLAKCYRDLSGKKLKVFKNILSNNERKKCRKGDFSFLRNKHGEFLECSNLVWSEGSPGYESPNFDELINNINRNGQCFFYPFQPGMLIPAAKELEKRKSDLAQLRKDRRISVIGLYIAGVALVLNFIWGIIKYFFLKS